jgi:hypothetical protein
MFHFANERRCSIQYGVMLKKKGVVAGVVDCFFPRSNDEFKDMWLELKSKGKKPTELQRQFMRDRELEGSYATWTDNFDRAKEIILSFYSIS